MPKTDYLNNPDAPRANSLVVAVAAVVFDQSDRILLIMRSDNGLWALPGGAQDIGESASEAAVREVREETGYDVEIVGISGLYSDPRHVIAYDDGEVRQEFSICFNALLRDGSPITSSESTAIGWFSPNEIDSMEIHPSMKLRVMHGFEKRDTPYIG